MPSPASWQPSTEQDRTCDLLQEYSATYRNTSRNNKNPEFVKQPLHRLNPETLDLVIRRG